MLCCQGIETRRLGDETRALKCYWAVRSTNSCAEQLQCLRLNNWNVLLYMYKVNQIETMLAIICFVDCDGMWEESQYTCCEPVGAAESNIEQECNCTRLDVSCKGDAITHWAFRGAFTQLGTHAHAVTHVQLMCFQAASCCLPGAHRLASSTTLSSTHKKHAQLLSCCCRIW